TAACQCTAPPAKSPLVSGSASSPTPPGSCPSPCEDRAGSVPRRSVPALLPEPVPDDPLATGQASLPTEFPLLSPLRPRCKAPSDWRSDCPSAYQHVGPRVPARVQPTPRHGPRARSERDDAVGLGPPVGSAARESGFFGALYKQSLSAADESVLDRQPDTGDSAYR